MVDMFFYRDPEEVEKQQQEEAQARAAASGEAEGEAAGVSEWDVNSAPQAGGINPAVVQEGGTSLIFSPFKISVLILLRCPRLVCGACCGQHRLVSRASNYWCWWVGCGRPTGVDWLGLNAVTRLLYFSLLFMPLLAPPPYAAYMSTKSLPMPT